MHLRDLATPRHLYPEVVTVPVGTLDSSFGGDETPIREKRIEELTADFQAHLVSLPVVSVRDDGTLVVLNGRHRVEMLRRKYGTDLVIEVRQFGGLSPEEEREIFERAHAKRKKKGKK